MSEHSPLEAPLLVGKAVSLRGLLPTDLNGRYFAWFNDAEVCEHNSHGRFPNSPERMASYYQHIATSRSDLVLAIVENASRLHVGNISLQSISWIDRTAEYAIIIGERSAWGKGVGIEASRLIVEHGFRELNLNRIYCGTAADNLGMQGIARRLGMKEEGRRRQAAYKRGAYRDVIEYGLLRSEWELSRSA